MIEKQFVSDGKRKFFKVDGTVSDVFLRVGRTDRHQQQGADYELQNGSVVFPSAPRPGVVVVVQMQDRTRVVREVRERVVHVETPVVIERLVSVPASGETVQPVLPSAQVHIARPVLVKEAVASESELGAAPAVSAPIPLTPQPEPLDDIKRATVLAIRSVADEFSGRLSEENLVAWNDQLARFAVDVWAAPTHAETLAAHGRAIQFIKNVTGQQ